MIVDDRLDTVLRTQTAGRAGLNTQLRQLVDLLGRIPDAQWGPRAAPALERLDQLHGALGDRAAAVLIGLCTLRSPRLVGHLARSGPRTALAAIGQARLSEAGWLALIPTLPIHARGALRHRRDLGPAVTALLDRLGIDDFALPAPQESAAQTDESPAPAAAPAPASATAPAPAPAPAPGGVLVSLPIEPARRGDSAEREANGPREGIGAIVRRIEAFRRNRAGDDPALAGQTRLPFAEEAGSEPQATRLDLLIDAAGMITAAEGADPAMLVGHHPFVAHTQAATASVDGATLAAFRARRPITAGSLWLDGAARISGTWRIDAVPLFGAEGGHYAGYCARLRRPPADDAAAAEAGREARRGPETLHQLLHELRTPINAIQGFAELIQQQLLGPTPHHYRSLAASIAADAARMLAGFEDVERLIRLETGRIDAPNPVSTSPDLAPDDTGAAPTDLAAIVTRVVAQLDPLITQREIRLAKVLRAQVLPVAMPEAEAERTVWRLLSTLIGAAAPGERMSLVVDNTASDMAKPCSVARLSVTLPAALAQRDDQALFAPEIARASAAQGAGMLGTGFALRLAVAEIRAAGGRLERPDGNHRSVLDLTLPLLTPQALDRNAVAS